MKRNFKSIDTIHAALKRKILYVLLALFFITLMSFADERRQVFNALFNTTTNDILAHIEITLNTDIKIGYIIIVLIALFALMTLIKTVRMRHQDCTIDQHKSLYRQFDMVAFLSYLLAIYVFINGFLFSISPVSGGSMEPTIRGDDYLVIEHINREFERFDFVVVKPDNHHQFMIKRLIGLPGDRITINNDLVYVNGEPLNESSYLTSEQVTRCVGESPCTFIVEPNHYFFLGDNRTNSYDSRHFGALSETEIFGYVNYRIRPLRSIGRIE